MAPSEKMSERWDPSSPMKYSGAVYCADPEALIEALDPLQPRV